jgi:hypothetical protein
MRGEVYSSGVGSAEYNADTFAGRGLVATGQQSGEGGGPAGFRDNAEHAPQRLLRLYDFGVGDQEHFFDVLLR